MYYSETQFYKEIKRSGNKVQLENQNGENIVVDIEYLEHINSVDRFDKTEKLSQTDLINLIMANPRTACSIYFQKADKPKTKKALQEEINAWAEKVKSTAINEGLKDVTKFSEGVSLIIPGEMRLIKGYHFGTQDERGRINFFDMEDPKKLIKGVDPRTISHAIVNNIKYIKK